MISLGYTQEKWNFHALTSFWSIIGKGPFLMSIALLVVHYDPKMFKIFS